MNDNTIDSWMPADIRDKINEVKKLPRDIPWRQATIDRLEKILEQVERSTHERV